MRSQLRGNRVVLPDIAVPRVLETARLFRDCKKASATCLILASGGDPAHHGVAESDVIEGDLINLGVPKEDILTEEKSNTTYENAKFSKVILQREMPDLTVLVTSRPHLPRALGLFEWFGMHPLPAPADKGK